mmetsp:Transcript_31632/g.72446  ORF Transcript_31632/g.72446 Transcript_31632/m.72446 type:complete len:89 (+) Transcript_31632:200-466(+)
MFRSVHEIKRYRCKKVQKKYHYGVELEADEQINVQKDGCAGKDGDERRAEKSRFPMTRGTEGGVLSTEIHRLGARVFYGKARERHEQA